MITVAAAEKVEWPDVYDGKFGRPATYVRHRLPERELMTHRERGELRLELIAKA